MIQEEIEAVRLRGTAEVPLPKIQEETVQVRPKGIVEAPVPMPAFVECRGASGAGLEPSCGRAPPDSLIQTSAALPVVCIKCEQLQRSWFVQDSLGNQHGPVSSQQILIWRVTGEHGTVLMLRPVGSRLPFDPLDDWLLDLAIDLRS